MTLGACAQRVTYTLNVRLTTRSNGQSARPDLHRLAHHGYWLHTTPSSASYRHPRPAALDRLCLCQGAAKVLDQVPDVLNANRYAHDTVINTDRLLFLC